MNVLLNMKTDRQREEWKMNKQTYVIWLEFDDVFTDYLSEKCAELKESHIAPGIRPPHLTLTFVETDDHNRLIQFVKGYLQKNMIDIEINAIGQFSGGILYYAPKVNRELLSGSNPTWF